MRKAVSGAHAADTIARRLTTAIAGIEPALAAVAPGRLASFSVAMDADASSTAIGGDCYWRAPGSNQSLHAAGTAVRFEHDAAARIKTERERWRLLGTAEALPLAFFTASPATAFAAAPFLWVPRVLIRRSPSGLVATLTAQRDATPASETIRAWQREALSILAPPAKGSPVKILKIAASPDATEWRRRVKETVDAIAAKRFAKAVLSRRLEARLSHPADPAALADRLAHLHPGCYAFALPCGRGHVVAASPELLAAKRGTRLVSHALAGTAERHGTPEVDARAATALLASAKERQEHAVVVENIAARMAKICAEVVHPAEPTVMPLRFVQHLCTPVTGRLRDGVELLDAVACLHPTPAVLGMPLQPARAWLAQVGERRDGLYSGAAGWIDLAGDGEAAVVLRAAYVEDRSAVLWAGAGIMAASDPEAELAETELKLATMLEALNAA